MAGIGWKWLGGAGMTENDWNGWKWLEMAGNCWNG